MNTTEPTTIHKGGASTTRLGPATGGGIVHHPDPEQGTGRGHENAGAIYRAMGRKLPAYRSLVGMCARSIDAIEACLGHIEGGMPVSDLELARIKALLLDMAALKTVAGGGTR